MPNDVYGPLDPRGWIGRDATGQRRIAGNLIDPVESWRRINQIKAEETDRAAFEGRFSGRPEDNAYDAERHARGSYRLAKEVGPLWAGAVGNLHELTGIAEGGSWRASVMDLHNNEIGRRAAAEGRPIPNRQTPGLKLKP